MPAQNITPKRSSYSASSISSAANANISATSTDEVTRRFNLLKDQTPELGGKILWNLASSGQPDAMLVESAIRALDLGQIKSGIETLKLEPIEQQKVQWENMSNAKQQIYLDNGYSVPKESSPWWKSALGTAFSPVKAGLRGIGAGFAAVGDTPIGTGVSAVGAGIGKVFDFATFVPDQMFGRPYRTAVDTSGQNQEARLDLTFEEARQSLEKQGVSLTDSDWEYLKWKYVEVNGLRRIQYGYEDSNPQENVMSRMMITGAGGGTALTFLDIASEINQVADIGRKIPGLGRLIRDPKTENPYDQRERSSGSGISDSVYEMFNNEVKKFSENQDYNLSAWSSWNRAGDGTQLIDPIKQVESIEKLRSGGLDNEAFDYALYRAKGRSQDEWLQEVEGITADDPRYEQRRLELAQTWEGQEVVKEVIGDLSASASKYSIGRGYAHAAGLDENSAAFTALSGAADAAVIVTLDPTLFLGKANKIWRVVRKGVQLADIPRIRWFATGLRTGENILDVPIVEGLENISKVSDATSSIDESFKFLVPIFSRSKSINKIEPLIDETGKVTDFAIDNYDDLKMVLDDAQDTLTRQRNYFVETDATNLEASGGLVRGLYPDEIEKINDQLNAIEIAKQVLLRIPPPEDSVRTLGRTLSHARVKQAENYNRWIDTVTGGFKKLRVATDAEEEGRVINDLIRSLPKGSALITELVKYDRELINRGFAGLDDYNSVWDFIEANQMLWGAGRGTGQAVKGFGNGTKVKDTWRLFSNGIESAVLDRNAYTTLPDLSKAGVFKQKIAYRSELALEQIKDLKNINKNLDADVGFGVELAVRIGSKPARMTAALLWNLTHQVPKNGQIFSLDSPDAVNEFRKLLNFGVFAGMKRKDQDIFMAKFVLGLGEDSVSRWIYNGTIKEGEAAYNAWRKLLYSPQGDELVDALRKFQGTKINPNFKAVERGALEDIFRETGQLTEYGVDNFDELHAIVDEVFANNLDIDGIQIFKKQIEANARAGTVASRFLVQRLFMEDLFRRTGMYDIPNAKETVDRFLNQMLSSRYAVNDLDKIGVGGAAQRVPLLPTAQYSDELAIPDFIQDIQKNATRLGALAKTIRYTFNTDIVETAMSTYWKPLTLMRLGFIPRAAGEEFLAFYARAGIWAPLSLAATQTAADRRGLLTGALNMPGRLTAKKFGELSRAGLDEDVWKLSAMAPHANVSDYIQSVANSVKSKSGLKLNRTDHLALHAAYWTGTVAKSIKQLQFRMLPQILQSGIAASMTQKNVNWVKNGLLTMDGLADTVRGAADVAMRDAYFQRGIASAHVDIGRTAAPNPLDETNDLTVGLTVRPNGYQPATETVTVRLSHEFEPVTDVHNATDTQISYAYSQADQELVLNPVWDEFAGAVDESTLQGVFPDLFRGTEFAVPVTVVEPETVLDEFVPSDLGLDIDLANPSDLLQGAKGDEAPDLLDRYVDVLRARAESVSDEARVNVDEFGNEVVLSNWLPEFTVDAEKSINDLDLIDRDGLRLGARSSEDVILEEGTPLSSRSQYVLDDLDIGQMSERAVDSVVPQLSDEDLLVYVAKMDGEAEFAEYQNRDISIGSENDYFEEAVRAEWAKRVETKKFTPEDIRNAADRRNVSSPYGLEEYAYQGDRTVGASVSDELIDDQYQAQYTEIVEQLSDKELLQLQADRIIRQETLENQPKDIPYNIEDDIIRSEWQRRQAAKKFQPEQIRQYLDELRAEGKLANEPYDLVQALVPAQDIAKKPYNIPASSISRERIVADLRRLAGRQSTPERSIWFNSEVLESSDEADKLVALANVIFEREIISPEITEAVSAVTRLNTEDVVSSANRFREKFLSLPKKDRDLIYRWLQGSEFVPNGSVDIEIWEKLGMFDEGSLLTSGMKSHLRHSRTNGDFNTLITRAINDRSGPGANRDLFDVLDVLLRTDSTRYRQVLVSEVPIRSAKKAELVAEAKTVILGQLNNPAFAKQVRGNRRYLVNSQTAQNMAIPSGDNAQQIYYVMAQGELNEQLIRSFRELPDEDFMVIMDAIADAGYDFDVVESVQQIIQNMDSEGTKALLEASVLRGGDMLPIGTVGFLDADHAKEVSEALEIALGTVNYFNVDDAGRTIRMGAANTAKDAKNIVLMPNTKYAARSLDDRLLWSASPLDPNNTKRFDDGGHIDDFGNALIEGGTIDENLDAWADVLSKFVGDLFFSKRGEVLHEVIQPMRRGTFGVDAVAQIPKSDLPAVLYRPKEFIPPNEKLITKAASVGFGKIINPAIFALVRHPMYLLAFSNGYEFARANNMLFRNAGLDKFADIWSKRNKVDLDEFRNIWHMIPEEKRAGIYSAKQLQEQLTDLAALDRFSPESTWVKFLDEDYVSGMTKEQMGDTASFLEWIKMDQNVERINVKVAMDRAMDEMIPYIDDHNVRSFFQEYARNIMPFEFAQEQFLKRWARTITYSPESLRRIQLLAHAFTTNGFVEEQNGQKYFVIPGTESLNSLLASAPILDSLFGGNIRMPTAIPMGMNTRNVLPGIPNDLENLPAFSPIAMFGVEQLSNHFPEIKRVAQEFNGGRPIESDDNILDSIIDFVPQNYQRLYAGLTRGYAPMPKGIDGEFSRNAIAAIQQAAAEAERLRIEQRQLIALGKEQEAADMQRRINQLDPPPNASPRQVEEWLDSIKDWTRANMFVRGALGFVLPTTATNVFEGKTLANEFGVLLGQMDFDTALATFLAEHPDGAAYTVFTSSKSTKAPIPTTEKAINWMRDNNGWMKSYPLAAPWLVPQSKGNDDFSQQAYVDALGMGIRNVKDVNEWYEDFKFAAGANRYFPTKEAYDLAKSEATSTAQRGLIEAQWQAESAIIKMQHPLFAQKLESMVSNEADTTMQQLRNVLALPDSELPDVEQIDGLREAVTSWDNYISEYSLLAGKNSKAARTKRENLKISFIGYGKDFLLRYPEMRTFWNSIVLSSLDLVSKKKILESREF
jgi:hypothetical protein